MIKQLGSRSNLQGLLSSRLIWPLLVCIGCAHRTPSILGTYRLEENAGFPLVIPRVASTLPEGDFQESALLFPGHGQSAGKPAKDCSLDGEIFSLKFDRATGSWTVRSLSPQGWNHLGSGTDIETQWTLFKQGVDRLQRRGCFPIGEDFGSMQRASAAVIPLPAGELSKFLYSSDAQGFIDLAPGMEIKVEELQMPTGPAVKVAPTRASDLQSAKVTESYGYLQTVRIDRGVALRRSKPETQLSAMRSDLYSDLPERFAATPSMRLFFESLLPDGSTRSAMLLGASSLQEIDAATELIHRLGVAACVTHTPGLVCIVFQNDSVSLLEPLWVNNRSKLYPFGTQLSSVLDSLPREEQDKALSSVRVLRPLAPNAHAEFVFPRTKEAARQVTLLPYDRIYWRQ